MQSLSGEIRREWPGTRTKKESMTYGSSFRGNLTSSDPKYSFRWVGTSDTLYVFEAPIDLLSYVSLHKEGWKQHSYVALCCVL